MKIKMMSKVFGEKPRKKGDFLKWKDYKWQLEHCIKDVESFEKLTKIKFEKKEKEKIVQTIKKFPFSITPYYLSLIDTKNYKQDPIFK